KGASFTYDVNAHVFSYHGPVEFARAAGLVEPTATAETKVAGWPPCIDVADLDPRTPIDTYVGNP
ncbi:MAG TPA: hypothetical protein VJP76_08020, partial [Candidatus Tumulicola sp.]|nr:hypothetical protein [Candidatus Tumulicola sp.]